MSGMIDRVAKAIAAELVRQANEDRAGTPYVDADDLRDAIVDGRVDLVSATRAGLQAMREPDEAMDRAAAECESSYVGDVYTAMIDAALKDDA